jgi:hypothetical protein
MFGFGKLDDLAMLLYFGLSKKRLLNHVCRPLLRAPVVCLFCFSVLADPKLAKYFEMLSMERVARDTVARQMAKDGVDPK